MIDGISVVICCYNSEERLPRVLKHLGEQDIDRDINWEVVIVDNASKDRTAEVALELWNRKEIPFRVVHEPKPGLSHARLTGFAESKFDVISFIDDDNWVESKWIEKVFTIMNNDSKIGILGGRGDAVFEGEPPFWFDDFQAAFAVGSGGKETGKQWAKLVRGAGMNIRRDSWNYLRSNEFDFILSGRKGKSLSSGEDVELCFAFLLAGFDIYYDNDLLFYHYMPKARLTWNYLVKLSVAFGKAAPVEDLYAALLRDTGISQLKKVNIFLSTLRTLYHYLRSLIYFVPFMFSDNEGNRKYLNVVYFKHSLLQRFRLLFVFPSYVSRIKNSLWYNNRNP